MCTRRLLAFWTPAIPLVGQKRDTQNRRRKTCTFLLFPPSCHAMISSGNVTNRVRFCSKKKEARLVRFRIGRFNNRNIQRNQRTVSICRDGDMTLKRALLTKPSPPICLSLEREGTEACEPLLPAPFCANTTLLRAYDPAGRQGYVS